MMIMKQKYEFNPDMDICEVDQFGFVNITQAFKNGYVPGNNASSSVEFDDASDPSAIIGKPGDVFEAMRMQDSLVDGIKNASKGSSVKSDEN